MSLLWQIDQKDAVTVKTSYVFGTIHFLDSDLGRMLGQVHQFLESCDTLLLETDMDQLNPANLSSYIYLPGDIDLEELLGSIYFDKLSDQLKNNPGIDLRSFSNYRPFYILMMLTQILLPKELVGSMDEGLWRQASELNLERRGAETIVQHLSVFETIQMDLQISMLKNFCRSLEKNRKQFIKLLSLYKLQNIRQLYLSSKKQLGKAKTELLFNRNKLMFESLKQNISQGNPTFMAVGAAHLWGNFGILAELKRAGFKVRPIDIF